jgi:hypothetical protein
MGHLRFGLPVLGSEIDFRNSAPRLAQIVQDGAKEAVEQFPLDLGHFRPYVPRRFAVAAQQHLENGKTSDGSIRARHCGHRAAVQVKPCM